MGTQTMELNRNNEEKQYIKFQYIKYNETLLKHGN